jgi:CRP/FNR family transcriptional regulator, cyclic AMP receptor protein
MSALGVLDPFGKPSPSVCYLRTADGRCRRKADVQTAALDASARRESRHFCTRFLHRFPGRPTYANTSSPSRSCRDDRQFRRLKRPCRRNGERRDRGEPFLPKINHSANPLTERSAHTHRVFASFRCGGYVTVTHVSEHNEVDFSLLVGPGFPTRFFAKGDTIFREGERGDETFVVVRGQVEIRSANRRLETVGAKGIFGEMALIDDSPRSATAVALTAVTVAPRSKKCSSSSWSSTCRCSH